MENLMKKQDKTIGKDSFKSAQRNADGYQRPQLKKIGDLQQLIRGPVSGENADRGSFGVREF